MSVSQKSVVQKVDDYRARWQIVTVAIFVFLTTALVPIEQMRANERPLQRRLESLTIEPLVTFEETHKNAFFMQPQISRGELSFDSTSGELVKQVIEPDRIKLSVSEERVSMQEDGKTRSIDLSTGAFPAQAFAALRALLAQDFEALAALFSAAFEDHDDQRWTMHLQPLDKTLRKELDVIVVNVSRNRIESIRTEFVNGDWQSLKLMSNGETGE